MPLYARDEVYNLRLCLEYMAMLQSRAVLKFKLERDVSRSKLSHQGNSPAEKMVALRLT